MSSTSHVSGFGENSKPSSKVLRPPGGGSSDIFGPESQAQTPRAVRNHMASNIFGSNDQNVKNNGGDSVRRSQKNIDSYSRLFGEPERPITPAKNFMKSSIPIGPNASAASSSAGNTKEMNGSSSSSTSSSTSTAPAPATNGHTRNGNKFENGGDHQNGGGGVTKTDGNPVTGEGYKPAGAEINTSVPALNGANQVIIKNRVPPGGYSSGLW